MMLHLSFSTIVMGLALWTLASIAAGLLLGRVFDIAARADALPGELQLRPEWIVRRGEVYSRTFTADELAKIDQAIGDACRRGLADVRRRAL